MRVCVIGAGVSGLPAIKSCLEEGLEVVCYERSGEIGGLWNYRPPHVNDLGGSVMKSTVVNTSKASIDGKTGKWVVKLCDGTVENFDFLMLCTGHHSIPKYPQFRGIDKFKGKIMHAKEYRSYNGFEDKDVFIIGIGNSALDIAVELAKIAKTVTVSTKRGSWIFNRVGVGGMPYDIVFMSRFYQWLMRTLPWSVTNDFMEHRLQQRMDHDLYGLRPTHRFFQQHPTVNDSLANLLASGMITITEDVDTFDENAVIVKGGRKFAADVLILATGYTFAFPYLTPQSLLPIKNHEIDLYKFVFSPSLRNKLAVIGLIQPIGSVAPISEMQSRWAAGVFSGRNSLPARQLMVQDIQDKRKKMYRRYFKSEKHTLQVDFVPYMDELAELIGCKPPLIKILFNDPRLALRLIVGANVPYVYRLTGPNNWSEAREAVWKVPERVKLPLKNRNCRMRRHKRRGTLDEYFRYMSMKWLAGYTCLILTAGLWVFCSGPQAISSIAYFAYVFVFLFIFSFMLLWFDLQYDMSTIF